MKWILYSPITSYSKNSLPNRTTLILFLAILSLFLEASVVSAQDFQIQVNFSSDSAEYVANWLHNPLKALVSVSSNRTTYAILNIDASVYYNGSLIALSSPARTSTIIVGPQRQTTALFNLIPKKAFDPVGVFFQSLTDSSRLPGGNYKVCVHLKETVSPNMADSPSEATACAEIAIAQPPIPVISPQQTKKQPPKPKTKKK